ncbi:MAG: HlyD family secretion protein [Candidatus Omnitrophica bacterium]|nr:HlyD family secretion protein [Candidatus Omnitrophota bacterium]MDD5546982.1 HlyD family secretion protein [Candidatus Omnitrophota bacterium]
MNLKNVKKTKLLGIFLAAGGAAAVVFILFIIGGISRVSTDDAYIEGRIHSIAAKIPGTVKTVNAEDNRIVKEGDVLVEIDPIDYELRVNGAQAALDIRKVAFEQASRDRDRAEALYKEEVYPKERFENAVTAYNLAKAQAEAAEAQFKIAQRNLEYTKICAPSDGHVAKRSVEAGNQIQPGQGLMAVVSNDMWVIANYKETQLKNVRPGQEVRIKIDTYPGKIFEGHVDSIQRGTGAKFSMFPPENASGNFVKVVQRIPVKIVFDGQPYNKYDLGVGMSVIAEIKVR